MGFHFIQRGMSSADSHVTETATAITNAVKP